jgi:serine/threonine protein kinase
MERLHGTLREKITWWDDPCTSMTNFRYRQRQRHSFSTKNPLWNTRIQILSDIANAMEYLHSKNIILRDLKSENAGFDINGKIKLFDFGLATALRNENKVGPDRYNFSVDGGTLRYMSPEAANGDPYGKATDVYSFALLAWETLSLSIPFASMSTEEFIHRVIEKRSRPKLNPKWPKYLKALFTKSWATNASYRPSFQQIQRQLDIDPVAQKNVQSNSCLSWLGRCRS